MIKHNLDISFEQQHTIHLRKYKLKKNWIWIITVHRMCISTMLQSKHLRIYIVHVQGVDHKYFWTRNKITYCSAIYWFNFHYTRHHFFKNWLKHNVFMFWYHLWRIASRDPSLARKFIKMYILDNLFSFKPSTILFQKQYNK